MIAPITGRRSRARRWKSLQNPFKTGILPSSQKGRKWLWQQPPNPRLQLGCHDKSREGPRDFANKLRNQNHLNREIGEQNHEERVKNRETSEHVQECRRGTTRYSERFYKTHGSTSWCHDISRPSRESGPWRRDILAPSHGSAPWDQALKWRDIYAITIKIQNDKGNIP